MFRILLRGSRSLRWSITLEVGVRDKIVRRAISSAQLEKEEESEREREK